MNKTISYLTFFIICINASFAAPPSENCPNGMIKTENNLLTIAADTCPTGYTAIGQGAATSCLATTSSAVKCAMFAPQNTPYSDNTGTYEYISICPLN